MLTCGVSPERLGNVSIMKTKVLSFLDQFGFCVQSCNRDLMPFSGIVGGNTIISLAPASWQTGPEGRSCAYQPSSHCHSDRNVGTRKQMKGGKSSAGLCSDATAHDIAHYVVPAWCRRGGGGGGGCHQSHEPFKKASVTPHVQHMFCESKLYCYRLAYLSKEMLVTITVH